MRRRASSPKKALEIELRSPQMQVFTWDKRFRILVAGRRFGKTYLALIEMLRAVCGGPDRVAWYVAPTYKQAKRIAWNLLKQLTKPYWAGQPNETDLRITLAWGGVLALRGADRYDSLRGEGLDFVVLDEYASMAPAVWPQVVRPALADRRGGALFTGTPRGFNHFYDLWEAAREQEDWGSFQFTTEEGGNVPAEELESAARELDERVYRQEFGATFENLTQGRVYYAFDKRDIQAVEFDPQFPLCWSLDFNINPACSVLCQVVQGQVRLLDEIVLSNSNTYDVCREFERRAKAYLDFVEQKRDLETPQEVDLTGQSVSLSVSIYGDATGNSRKSGASQTDWQIVHDFFSKKTPDYKVQNFVLSTNPAVKDRVNCVNAIICNAKRERRLVVAPHCKQLIRDLEQVTWKSDVNGNMTGELDHSDPQRTHLSDALGYFIARQIPIQAKVGFRPGHIH